MLGKNKGYICRPEWNLAKKSKTLKRERTRTRGEMQEKTQLRSAPMWLRIEEREEEIVQTGKRELEHISKENNELREKVTRLSAYLIQKEKWVKALAHQVKCMQEISSK